MKGWWYKLVGVLVILVGLSFVGGNIFFKIIDELTSSSPNIGEIFLGGVLGSIGLAILFLTPGIFLLRLEDENKNKLTDYSIRFLFWAFCIIIISLCIEILINGIKNNPFAPFLAGGVIIGIILSGLALIILIINWIKSYNK